MSDAASSSSPHPFVGSGPNGTLTEVDARTLLDEQAHSGLSFQHFAFARGLSPQRLSWWKSKFEGKHPPRAARRPRGKKPRPAASPRFVPVVAAGTAPLTRRTAPTAAIVPTARGAYELALGGALTLRIPHDFADDTLARIVRVLQGAR